MCGFFLTNDTSVDKNLSKILTRRLAFRGPDFQSDIIFHEGWRFYHSRLSIIATGEAYRQPFFSPSGGVLVFNGEILNFEELASKYSIKSRNSDTHVLSELLELDNFDLNEIDGFFAFAFVNKGGRLTHCARDRFGVKPLSFIQSGNAISISSEASVLSDLYKRDYSPEALEEYRVFRAPILSESYFRDIKVVQPGECLINGKYFDSLRYIPEVYSDMSTLLPELRVVIRQSIESRLISDVPVGLLYSGGIDSNLVASYLNDDIPRFTGGLDDGYDMEFAKSMVNVNSQIINVSNDQFSERFREMIILRKEPLSVPNEVILSILAEDWAKRGGKVLLSGEAADELYAGYDRIFYWALNAKSFSLDEFLSFYAYVPLGDINNRIKQQLEWFFENLSGLSPFEKVRQFFIKKHLPILFRRLDFSLMYGGIEGREPLASFDMFKLALKFRPADLFVGSLGKYPLRKIASDSLGSEFAFREKVGFPVDIKEVFMGIKSSNRHDNYEAWCSLNKELIL
jgi:asparagine synthase (glutamine-hydrolysing)